VKVKDRGYSQTLRASPLLYEDEVMLLLFREYHINIAYDKMMDISWIKKMARKMNIDMVGKGIPCLPYTRDNPPQH